MITVHIGGFGYLPWPLYLETFLCLGPLDLAALPPLRFPKVIFLESVSFPFAMVLFILLM